MKTVFFGLTTLVYVMSGSVRAATVTVTVPPGFSTISNPLNAKDNTLRGLFGSPYPPDGTQIFKYNSATSKFDVRTFDAFDNIFFPNGTLTLLPGEGALIRNPSTASFKVTFSGDARSAPQPLANRAPGLYLLGSQVPQSGAGFFEITGFQPKLGDKIYKFDVALKSLPTPPDLQQASSTHTFGPGGWDVAPTVEIGKAVFISLASTAVLVAPALATQPQSQTVSVSASVTFVVNATGTTPLSYQWKKNGTSIPGASHSTLTLANVSQADEGQYTVVVSNVAGSVTSQEAALTLNPPAVVPSQFHPADANQDWSVNLGEVLSYATAFKRGSDWPVNPNPIPLGYVIRGFTLYKTGERYKFDAVAGSAPASWVSDATKP